MPKRRKLEQTSNKHGKVKVIHKPRAKKQKAIDKSIYDYHDSALIAKFRNL